MVTSGVDPNTWAHVAVKGAHDRNGTVDNRIEVVPRVPHMTRHWEFPLLSTT